ncbi:MAG: pyruvate kinase alpha/beta domain-containing protein [Bacillota bacterium]
MYFQTAGSDNTERTVSLCLDRAQELDIRHVVVASTQGVTAREFITQARQRGLQIYHAVAGSDASAVPQGMLNLVVVTHQVGFREPGVDEMPPEVRRSLVAEGVRVLTTTHLFSGVDRAITKEFGGLYPGQVVAHALYMFSQGVKVAVEVAVMALDAGLIPYGQEVISVGGSGRGADSALVVLPAYSRTFFETKILELICKPRDPGD